MSVKSKTIQEKMTELTDLIAWFDSDDFKLEEALDMFKKAQVLADDIESELDEFQNDITVLKQKFDRAL